jgi:hypothetical protein
MRVTWNGPAISALVASVLVGCSSSGPTVAVGYEQFRFTCCANSEALMHAWHPGGGTHSETLLASPIRVTDRTSGSAVSTIALPLDLAPGWFNLVTTIESAGDSTGGATVIQVTRLSS